MATIDINYKLKSLMHQDNFKIISPIENTNQELKTIYLLHGMYNDYNDWIRRTKIIDLTKDYKFNAILLNGRNSYYINDQTNQEHYSNYIKEIQEITEKIINTKKGKENNIILGASMGGFGALYNGLKYHENFGKIISLAPVIPDEIKETKKDEDYTNVKQYIQNKLNKNYPIKEKILKLEKEDKLPQIHLSTGPNDYLYESNTRFKEFLDENNIPYTYHEYTGQHKWKTWNQEINTIIEKYIL